MSPGNERAPATTTGTPSQIGFHTERPQNITGPARKLTQRDRILAMLLEADAVCSTTFLDQRMPRAASSIYRLRKEGFVVVSRPCMRGHDHENPQIEYSLIALPTDPTNAA